MTIWLPTITRGKAPLYQTLASAIEQDIRSGLLGPGMRLPTHRDLADALGVNVSTVTRGYAEAERRKLVHATVGRGTFVTSDLGACPPLVTQERQGPGIVEMGIVTPLYGLDPDIGEGLRRLSTKQDLNRLMRYATPPGMVEHRSIGAIWLKRHGLDIDPARVVITAGGQHALACCLTAFFHPGQRLAVDSLTYPGIKSLAATLGIRLTPIKGDSLGMSATDLDTACRREDITGVYLMPGTQNPTTLSMPLERRDEIARVIRRHNLILVEDDTYGLTRTQKPTPPISTLVDKQGVFITSVSKAFGPGLRVAFVAATEDLQARLSEAVLNTVWMASPITTELACSWIMDGTADDTVAAKQEEARLRYGVATKYLAGYSYQGYETGFFLWLNLPEPWSGAALELRAKEAGVNIFGAERFSVGHEAVPAAVRISLSGPTSLTELANGLDIICGILEGKLQDLATTL